MLKFQSGFHWLGPFRMGVLVFLVTYSAGDTISSQLPGENETHFTPVVMSVLTEPSPVLGSDGLTHFVYELQLTNATSFPVQVESLEVLGGAKGERALAAFAGTDVSQIMQEIMEKSPTDTLKSGLGAVAFIHFTVDKPEAGRTSLVHRLTISGQFPPGFTHFMGLPASANRIVEIGGPTKIHSPRPIIIGPPLEGKGWIAADGCCTAKRHIRAIMPINGRLRVAQRFAIDWVLINDEQRLFAGDPSDVKSYFAYGKKVLAVSDATVVSAIDKYENQVPGKLPSDMTLAEVYGNHVVLDLGNEQFAFYAHFQPGSLREHGVKVGDRVCRGQVLGLVGNSGNTSSPHLHFHVMSSPSPLGSDGIPYVIEDFELLGRAPSTEAIDKAEQDGTPLVVQEVDHSGKHSEELPLDLSVVAFPPRQPCGRSPEKQ